MFALYKWHFEGPEKWCFEQVDKTLETAEKFTTKVVVWKWLQSSAFVVFLGFGTGLFEVFLLHFRGVFGFEVWTGIYLLFIFVYFFYYWHLLTTAY